MAKRVYNVHLLIETDQESDTLAEQVREWASNEEAFGSSVLLDITQIREAHVDLDLDTFSATMKRIEHGQEDIVNALGKSTTINEQYIEILRQVASALTLLVKEAETSTKPDDGVWRRNRKSLEEANETAADEEAKDETAVEDKASGARYWRDGTSWGEGVFPEMSAVEDETAADEEAKDETPNEL